MHWYRIAAVALLTPIATLGAAFTVGPFHAVTTGGISMQPRISAGDLVAVAPSTSYGVGDVAAYRSALLDTVVLHRIVAVEGDRYVFQGDNNAWVDPEKPTLDELVGKQLLHVPRGGLWLQRLTSPPALAAYTFLLLAGGTAAATTKRQRRKERRTVTSNSPPPRLLDSLSPSLRPLAAGAAALGLAGAALGGLAWTRPATALASPSVEATMDFSYTATVPPSPAYDSTTVTAPSAVFRSLTDAVDVSYRYAGEPGSLTVAAELSTPSGWTATVPLAARRRIGAEHEGAVRLDLTALRQRATAAAKVIGLPATTVTIDVVPTVTLDGGGEFAPALAFALDEYALKPTGELTAAATTPVTGTREAPATLSALGRSIDVARARMVAPAAAAAGLVMSLGLAVTAGLRRRVPESERIHRQYGALLLPVLPVALTPGRPVIDVPDVGALARLAERYGLLVLHWSRSGVDTYVVQDEATTYRYRSEPAPAVVEADPAEDPRLVEDAAARSWAGTGNDVRSR